MTTARILLPFPPSTNGLYRAHNGRVIKSKKYREFEKTAAGDIANQRPPTFHGEIALKLTLGRPDKRRRDIDNYCKATIDALVMAGILEDHRVHSLSATWSDDIEGCVVEIADWVLP